MRRPKRTKEANQERLERLAEKGNPFARLALGRDPETGKTTKKEK